MKTTMFVTLALLVAGCAGQPVWRGAPLTQERAVQLALAELRRAATRIEPSWPIKASRGVHMPELAPNDVPLYLVTVYNPTISSNTPLYIVAFERDQTISATVYVTVHSPAKRKT